VTRPAKVVGGLGLPSNPVVQLSGGSSLVCARTSNATVFCWGGNYNGETGQPPTNPAFLTTPTVVAGTGRVADLPVPSNTQHMCAVREDRGVVCWGRNASSELGLAPPPNNSNVPLAVAVGAVDPAGLILGAQRTCLRSTTGAVTCWGSGGFSGLTVPCP
jgi:hypothetical protein